LESGLALALDLFREHGTPAASIAELARFARDFVEHLSRPHALPPPEAVEAVYATIRKCEGAVGHRRRGRHGIRATTDDEMAADRSRRERVDRAYDNYRKRRAVDAAVKQVAIARAAAATERDSLWEPVAPPPGLAPPQNNRSGGGPATPAAAETPQDVLQRAREISEAIKCAGQHAGAARRGERLCRLLP
jgi:hypothetical protein